VLCSNSLKHNKVKEKEKAARLTTDGYAVLSSFKKDILKVEKGELVL
jgi:hypothetical protein